jgi:D-threonate/D-erythronate kinase
VSPAAQLPLTIVADDLTGACDTGALFAARGPVPVTVWPDPPMRAPISVVDTESRAIEAADAARRVAGVARSLARSRFFKKIDSTVRGPIGAEIDALLRASSCAGALVCPALPAEHRVVVERVLTVGAIPVAETPIAEDPTFPRASGSSNLVDILRPQIDRPLAWIPLGRVREGGSPLTARLVRLAGMVIVADAETDADLDALVEAVLELDTPPLLVGSAGLALALARRLGLAAARVDLPAAERWLIVAGSRHPATRRQIEAAREAGLTVLAIPDAPQPDRSAAVAELAAQARARLDAERFDVVLVTGGETLVALYHAFGAERLDLEGAPRPGLALGRLRAPGREQLTLITKAGGFGEPDLFVSLAREAVA